MQLKRLNYLHDDVTGRSSDQLRLGWLLDFAVLELDALSEKELSAMLSRAEEFAMNGARLTTRQHRSVALALGHVGTARDRVELYLGMLRPMQRHGLAAIQAAETGQLWQTPRFTSHVLMASVDERVLRDEPTHPPIITIHVGDPIDLFAVAVAESIAGAWQLTRTCARPKCGRRFMPRQGRGRKPDRCSASCTSAEGSARERARQRHYQEGLRKRRAARRPRPK